MEWKYYARWAPFSDVANSIFRIDETGHSQKYVPRKGWEDSSWLAVQLMFGGMSASDMVSASEAEDIAERLDRR